MLIFQPPYLVIHGLTIFPDHADKNQFYYFPAAPRLSLQPDGSAAFLFVKYRTDPTRLPVDAPPGGGFLAFDVDLRVDDDVRQEVAGEIKRQLRLEQTPTLAPVDARSGTVRLILLDMKDPPTGDEPPAPTPRPGATPPAPQLHFVERATYSAVPSLYGENRSSFNVQLTAEGATLIEQTLDTVSSLVGVVYDLRIVGLRPAYNVKLSIDWDRVQTFLDQRFEASFVFVATDIESAVQELIENRVIQLEATRFVAASADPNAVGHADDQGAIARADEAAQFVKEMITEKFFEPSLNPQEAIGQQWWANLAGAARSFRPTFATYTKRDFTRIDKRSLRIDVTEISAVERQIVPQGHLQGLAAALTGRPRSDYVREVDLADPFFQTLEIEAIADKSIEVDRITGIKVHFEYGGKSDDVLLTASDKPQHVRFAFDPTLGRRYKWSAEVTFAPDAPPGVGNQIRTPLIETNETKLVVAPRTMYFVQNAQVVLASTLDLDRYPSIKVDLRYNDDAAGLALTQGIVINKDNAKPLGWPHRLADPAHNGFEWRASFSRRNALPYELDWRSSPDPVVLLDDPQPVQLNVTVAPAVDGTKVQKLFVALRYEDAKTGTVDQLLSFVPGDKEIVWAPHVSDPTQRGYKWRATFVYKDGSSRETPWASSSETLLLVNEVFRRDVHVTIGAIGRSFDAAGVARIELKLSYDDGQSPAPHSASVTLGSLTDTSSWQFTMLDPARDSYHYEITIVTTEGFRRRMPARDTNQEQLSIAVA